MDRITSIAENGENVIILNNSTPGIWSIGKSATSDNTYKLYGFVADRLAAYENIGLTPDEVAALKADKERRDKLIEENEALLWDKRCAPCPNCGGTHIQTYHKWLRKHKKLISSYYYGYCASCKYKGNAARLPSEAIKAWNDGAEQARKRGQK